MEKIGSKMRASVSRGCLNLRPVGSLHELLDQGEYDGHYRAEDRDYSGVAIALVQSGAEDPRVAKLQLRKGPKADRGEIELPYEKLSEDGKRLYELLDGTGRVYLLDANVYSSQVLHVFWPTKEAARRSVKAPARKEFA